MRVIIFVRIYYIFTNRNKYNTIRGNVIQNGLHMKILIPASNKGGVGKSKIASILAEYFSIYKNKKVLVIDFDPQCNTSQRYLNMELDPTTTEGLMPPIHPDFDPEEDGDWEGRSSIADIFFGEEVVAYETKFKNLEILPGWKYKLMLAEAVRKSEVAEKVYYQLKKFLSLDDVTSLYDIVIVDTAPSTGPLTQGAIKAATHLIIPTHMEEFSLQGVYGMLQLWKQEAAERPQENPLTLLGVLPNRFKNTSLHKDFYEGLSEDSTLGKYLMPVYLSDRIKFSEVDTHENDPKSIFELPDSNTAKIEAKKVCEYIEKRVFP